MKTREKGNFDWEVYFDLTKATQLAQDEGFCWKEYQCVYTWQSSVCLPLNEVANYGTLPVYIVVPCPQNMPVQ